MSETNENPSTSQFQAVDWQAIARANNSRVVSLTQDTVVFTTTRFGELRLTEVRPGVLQLHTSDLPDVTLVPGFKSDGYTSNQLITYVEGGQLVPTDVLSDRLLCVLRGDPLGSQAWRPTGLRATPERLLELKAGSVIETVKEWWFSPDDKHPVYRKGDRLRVEYIILDIFELEGPLTAAELEKFNWAKDGVQATLLTGSSTGTSIDLLFSDFVLVDEGETTEGESTAPTT